MRGSGEPEGRAAAAPPPQPSTPAEPPAQPAPDNTRVNERDRSATVTPMNQGNNETDLKTTQRIRQAVMADDSLSFSAKNVKIITSNGKVTLRGVVESEDERKAIDDQARKVAGSANVDDRIEVKQ
jgi:osmotically-inducible protein OsmY